MYVAITSPYPWDRGVTERRKVEEYSSLKVIDSDNNSIKEFVESSELSFRTNFQDLSYFFTFTLEFENRIADFHFRMQKKEEGKLFRCIALYSVCF